MAWKNYDEYHKSPRKRKPGAGVADPEFELPIEWLDARQAIQSKACVSLTDWLLDMELVDSGNAGTLDRYIGYYEPYATSHQALDRDRAVQEEVRNVARSLVTTVRLIRTGKRPRPDESLMSPRPK